jgi:hypothetical protein
MKNNDIEIEAYKKIGFSKLYYELYLISLDWENGKISNEDYAERLSNLWNDFYKVMENKKD